MKITIDISAIIYGTGVSVYTRNLVENLLLIDRTNDYTFFGGSFRRMGELKEYVNAFQNEKVVNKIFPIPPTLANILWNKLHVFPIEMFTGKSDVFHASDWTQPPSKAFKVTTIHDLSPILFPGLMDKTIENTHKSRLNWVIKEADRVIVPSITTANDVVNLGLDKSKVRVISEAVSDDFKPATENHIAKIRSKYGLGKYILAIGVNPRKNTDRIINAFQKIKKEANLKLVILGQPHMSIKQAEDIIFTGHIPESEKPAFFTGAEALVYPSIYEGFGLPILEAYTCGTPVVTSNNGSMAEIASDVAFLVNPKDVDSIADGILKAVKGRVKTTQKGLSYARKFSWQKTAKATLDVYKENL